MRSANGWFDKFMPGIMRCRLDDLVLETPVQVMPALSERLGVDIRLKREDLQPVFSFKLRGAYAKLLSLGEGERARGVICASAGNHAQGVALAARHLGINATVVMPAITPEIKVNAVEKQGARVVIHGDDFDAACARALDMTERENLTFVHPYDDPEVITGQATIAMELFRQCHVSPDYLFVCVGGGGLAAGMAIVSRYLQPETKIIGVEAAESASMKAALEAGEPVTLEKIGHFAEGVAVKRTGDLTYRICADLLDDVITVDNDEICAAVQDVYEDTRAIAEPAGVLAVAGIKKYFAERAGEGRSVAAVLSGANVNFARLRHIAERAAVGEETEAPHRVLDSTRAHRVRDSGIRLGRAGGGVVVQVQPQRLDDFRHQEANALVLLLVAQAGLDHRRFEAFADQGFADHYRFGAQLGDGSRQAFFNEYRVGAHDALSNRFRWPARSARYSRVNDTESAKRRAWGFWIVTSDRTMSG